MGDGDRQRRRSRRSSTVDSCSGSAVARRPSRWPGRCRRWRSSTTRNSIVCSSPTMPKRGAASMTMRRSRSSRLPVSEGVHRRVEAELAGVAGHVVDLAVGDHDHAGEALGRNVGDSAWSRAANSCVPRRRRCCRRAPSTTRTSMLPDCASASFSALGERSALGGPVRAVDALARALVDDDDGDVGSGSRSSCAQDRVERAPAIKRSASARRPSQRERAIGS